MKTELLVKKFGGSSLANSERIDNAAKIIAESYQSSKVCVVVSAMYGETERLNQLSQMGSESGGRELAALLATGEQVAASLLSMSLNRLGCPAQSFQGWQVPIRTGESYVNTSIEGVAVSKLNQVLTRGVVPVVTGFQGVNDDDEIAILHRGGSDTTAVALASSLGAEKCQIYTDVEGVCGADPAMVADVGVLKELSYEEMLDLSSLGSQVLQFNSVELACKKSVTLQVLSSIKPGDGTYIVAEENLMSHPNIRAVAHHNEQAQIAIEDLPNEKGVAYKILEPLGRAGVKIDMVIQSISSEENKCSMSFTLSKQDCSDAMSVISPIVSSLGGVLSCRKDLAKLSVVGIGMKSRAGVVSSVLAVLAKDGINIEMMSTSEINISMIIHAKYIELGVRSLVEAYQLNRLDLMVS
ncbi:MAG TPA: aspartate kinase [Gammaproteobacteria bacterium]|nr:aspartate kinase [Gammaproteobacteria bacterium]